MSILTACWNMECGNVLKEEFRGQIGLCVVCDGMVATHNTKTCSNDGCKNLLKICYPAEATRCRLHKTYFDYSVFNYNSRLCTICEKKVGTTAKQLSSHYHNEH